MFWIYLRKKGFTAFQNVTSFCLVQNFCANDALLFIVRPVLVCAILIILTAQTGCGHNFLTQLFHHKFVMIGANFFFFKGTSQSKVFVKVL